MVQNGYYKNDGFIFTWDLGAVFFRHTEFGDWEVSEKKKFFNFGLKGVVEKCVGFFLPCRFIFL